MEELAAALGKERLLLELLVYRLVELRGLVVAGEGRFLGWAAEEVERATHAVQQAEMQRALVVSEHAADKRLPDDALDLATLIAGADEPWRTMLAEHGDAMRALAREVAEHAAAVRRLSRAAERSVDERLAALDGEPAGGAAPDGAPARLGAIPASRDAGA